MVFISLLYAVIALFLGLTYLWYNKPGIVIKYANRLMFTLLGFKNKYLYVDGKRRWCYVERGVPEPGKPSLILLHGFTSTKEVFLPVCRFLPREYCHVIALDNIGHGGTSLPPEDMPLTREAGVMLLHEFISLCGLDRKPIHLAGISLGGLLAGCYAAKHPEYLSLLTLICPGMISPKRTKFVQDMLKGSCALLPKDVEGMYRTLKLVSARPTPENDQLLNGILDLRAEYGPYHTAIYEQTRTRDGGDGEDSDLRAIEMNAEEITMPTQVIWGKNDMLLDASGAELLKKRLPNCQQVDLLDNCGHMIGMDQPQKAANCLISFRQLVT